MSQPTPYTPNADFSQQEANNASGRSTVNTAALDAEFAAIETTLDQTLENIQLIQRDDGKLGDVLVEVRCLAPDVLNIMGGFNITGLWTPATQYEVNDICSNGDYTYVCKTEHVSGGSFVATNWIQFGFTAGADAAQAAAAAQVSANSAASSEINALAYKNSAQSSATSATASASSASTSAATATTQASNAASSATSSSNSAAAAAAAAASIGGSVTATNTVTMTNKTLVAAKNDKLQLGVSGTATQNFTLTAEAADGTMKLARGNPGATTQDILTVKTDNTVDFTVGIFGFAYGTNANGSYIKFPGWMGGVIIQWGTITLIGGGIGVAWPIEFPTACQSAVINQSGASNLNVIPVGFSSIGTTGANAYANSGTPGCCWIAIGK